MEQHPVPQNVTTFQFRLIGDMTLKQFGYLCAGAILSYISYKLPLPFLFTWPLAALFALLGIGFAFVPIEERPMDVWVFSFFKRIYSPTQYVWQRISVPEPTHLASHVRQKPATQPVAGKAPAPGTEPTRLPPPPPPSAPADFFSGLRILSMQANDPFGWIKNLVWQKPKTAQQPVSAQPEPMPSVVGMKPTSPTEPLAQPQPAPPPAAQAGGQAQNKATLLEEKVVALEAELRAKTTTDKRLLELQKQLSEVLAQKRAMEEELDSLRRKLQAQQVPQPTRVAGSVPAGPSTPSSTIKVIAPEAAAKSGLPRLTNFPNIITGIVKDSAGNLLTGILVTVRDKDDVPLRALKTNKLGQFAASTPLAPGTYLIEVEDPRGTYVFDRAQITVNNTVLPTIEVIAKSQKELERARLAQQIFGEHA